MADSTPITPPVHAGDGRPVASPRRTGAGKTAFDAHLTGAHHRHHAARPGQTHHGHSAASHHAGVQHASAYQPQISAATPSGPLPEDVRSAIGDAIDREQVPASWQDGLEYIATQESGGQIDAHNPHSSARGLFQLTRANYRYNPNGAESFGDPVEEAQGGIRYILDRYGDIDAAVSTWQRRRTY